jgi:hypothetical protein
MEGLGFLIYNTCVGLFKPNGYGFKKQIGTDLSMACLSPFSSMSKGCSIRDLAPEVVSKVAKRALISMTVDQALENRQWITHIKPPLSLVGIQQFLFLWDTLGEVQLSQEEDHHVWRHEASGLFSSKSCYNVLFFGSTVFEPWKRLWKTWAPPKCKFFL